MHRRNCYGYEYLFIELEDFHANIANITKISKIMTWHRILLHAKIMKIWSAEGGKEAMDEHSSVLEATHSFKITKKNF